MDGDSPRRSPRKKSLAEIKAEARKKMNNKGGADPTVLVDDPDATALASKVDDFDCYCHKLRMRLACTTRYVVKRNYIYFLNFTGTRPRQDGFSLA